MIQLDKYIQGKGQRADQLPSSWECFTRAELESIIADILRDRRARGPVDCSPDADMAAGIN